MIQQLLKTEIRTETDVVAVRKKARDIAEVLNFDNQDQIRIATAVSEIARNAYEYAQGGMVDFKLIEDNFIRFVIVIKDHGPGIEHLKEILRGTYISPQGMGLGISGAKKLMDDVQIETQMGKGSTVTLFKILPHRRTLLNNKEIKILTDKLMATVKNPIEELYHQNQEILQAVAELKDKREELLRINQELEDTNRGVVALYAELDEKAEILRAANESKTSFLADMTHEFRSPLNSILSISQIILNDAKKEGASEREKQVNFIIKAARGLSDLVNDLLDIAKIEAGKITLRVGKFPVSDIFSSLRGLMRPIGGSEKVELLIEEVQGINLETDEAKLTQILRNLISNSLKYTEEGQVRVTAHQPSKNLIRFEVKDTGIGIDSENLESIFEEFFQVDNAIQQRNKGTGLGLALSRNLARLLGGNLWAESPGPGKGSQFILELPLVYQGPNVQDYESTPSKMSTNFSPPKPGLSTKKKVLIIDDEESVRYGIKSSLQILGVDIREASDGEEGLSLARVYLPDLIILDLVMPNKDGMTFISEAMGQIATRNIPIVLHTSKPLDDEERAYLEQVTSVIVVKEEKSYERIKTAAVAILGIKL